MFYKIVIDLLFGFSRINETGNWTETYRADRSPARHNVNTIILSGYHNVRFLVISL